MEQSENDRLALQETLKTLEDGHDRISEEVHSGQHPFSMEGLSIAKRYLEGALEIVLHFERRPAQGKIGFAVLKSHIVKCRHVAASGVSENGTLGLKIGGRWEDALMLIGDIEPMEIEKAVLPSRVGLSLISDKVSDSLGGAVASFYVSVDGTLYRSPILGAKGEAAEILSGMPIGFNEDTVCVIEGSPEIMESISKNRGSVLRGLSVLDHPSTFQRVLLILGAKSLQVLKHVAPKEGFELLDVLFGPFYFKIGA